MPGVAARPPRPAPFPALSTAAAGVLRRLSTGLSTSRWAAAALLPIVLAGCFSTDRDLIGDHALAPVQLDSLVTLNGYPYRLDQVEQGTVACELRRKTDTAAGCWESYRLKFERSTRGNLIIQGTAIDAKFLDEGRSIFLLAELDDQRDRSCYHILGAPGSETPPAVAKAEQAIVDRFGEDEGWIDRPTLLAIVDAYERTVLPLDRDCPATRLTVVQPDELRFADEPVPASPPNQLP